MSKFCCKGSENSNEKGEQQVCVVQSPSPDEIRVCEEAQVVLKREDSDKLEDRSETAADELEKALMKAALRMDGAYIDETTKTMCFPLQKNGHVRSSPNPTLPARFEPPPGKTSLPLPAKASLPQFPIEEEVVPKSFKKSDETGAATAVGAQRAEHSEPQFSRAGPPPQISTVPEGLPTEDTAMATSRTNMTMSSFGCTPRGEFVHEADNCNLRISFDELQTLERLVARTSRSPLGCLDFEKTFRKRQADGHILTLKSHALEGTTFGQACIIFARVTLLGLKQADGRVLWAPDSAMKIQGSDGVLLIGCTPSALAMGLINATSLAESNMFPTGAQSPFLSPTNGHRRDDCCESGVSPCSPFAPVRDPNGKDISRRCCGY